MPTSRYSGTLHAVILTPPFQKLKRAVDGANEDMAAYLVQYFTDNLREALWGSNVNKYERYRAMKAEEKKRKKEIRAISK